MSATTACTNCGCVPTSDPIVDRAGAMQGVLAGWVDAVGVLPFAIALAALVAGTVLAAVLRARRAVGRPH
jgi:hypothetical protein